MKTGLFSEKINSIRQHVDTRYFCPLPENIIEHIYEMHVTSLKMDLKNLFKKENKLILHLFLFAFFF